MRKCEKTKVTFLSPAILELFVKGAVNINTSVIDVSSDVHSLVYFIYVCRSTLKICILF